MARRRATTKYAAEVDARATKRHGRCIHGDAQCTLDDAASAECYSARTAALLERCGSAEQCAEQSSVQSSVQSRCLPRCVWVCLAARILTILQCAVSCCPSLSRTFPLCCFGSDVRRVCSKKQPLSPFHRQQTAERRSNALPYCRPTSTTTALDREQADGVQVVPTRRRALLQHRGGPSASHGHHTLSIYDSRSDTCLSASPPWFLRFPFICRVRTLPSARERTAHC